MLAGFKWMPMGFQFDIDRLLKWIPVWAPVRPHCAAHRRPMGFKWDSNVIPMGSHWGAIRVPIGSNGIPLECKFVSKWTPKRNSTWVSIECRLDSHGLIL